MYCSGAACCNGGNSRVHCRRKKRMRRIIGCILLGVVLVALTVVLAWLLSYELMIPMVEATAWMMVAWIGIALFGAMLYGIITLICGD